MKLNRASGILLHPTSLPGPFGIGDLGPTAERWIDFLAQTGCMLWQLLPLGPTGYGDSPYQCFSASAGNPNLVSPELLLREGLLSKSDLLDRPNFPARQVDYGAVIAWKSRILDQAYGQFESSKLASLTADFDSFMEEESSWLTDFSLFMALKEAFKGAPWSQWPASLRLRAPESLERARGEHAIAIRRHAFRQFIFFRQWEALRSRAIEKGIRIIGDIPIFVAYDSADVWARPELFYLDQDGKPTVVAGVPPDYFSPTGQLWGNPLYRWDVHAQEGYAWWIARLQAVLRMVDYVRLDHFRGFAGYWEVPFGNTTAEIGRWVPGPGESFFSAVQVALGELPIIAEDLGEITPDVIALRDRFGLPGMKVLVFGFSSGPKNEFLPHHYQTNCIAYTGTHDNDTVLGWFGRVPKSERTLCLRYLNTTGDDIAWDLIRAVWSSVAVFAITPMQDVLRLDNAARMNYPGQPSGNWVWRMESSALSDGLGNALHEINYLYDRLPLIGQDEAKSLSEN